MFSLLKQLPKNLFLILFIASSLLALYELRHNNLTMVKLRNDVYQADKDNGDVNAALNNLRQYVYSHMNTDLSSGGNSIKPPIQLKYTYERLQSTADAGATSDTLYTAAQNYCQKKFPAIVSSLYGSNRLACVQDYILNHGGRAAPKVPPALYQFDFASPTWSPDAAGWSLVAAAILAMALMARVLADRRAPHKTRG